jgi:metallopeptidase M23 family
MKITKYYRHVKTTYWKTAFLIALAGLFLLPSYTKIEKTGNNVYEITLNGEQVGTVSDTKDADSLLWQARKEIAKEEDVLFLADAELSVTGREAYFAQFTGEDEIIANMKEVLTASQISTIRPAFTIKINQLMINLSSVQEVSEALQAALDQYQEGKQFVAQLGPDQTRELNMLTVEAKSAEEKKEEEKEEQDRPLVAGCTRALADMVKDTQAAKELTFDDFDYGLTRLSYADNVEIVESYLPADQIQSLSDAKDLLTKEQDQQQIYEVQQGDTLSEIAINCDIPLDKIIELNDSLEDENSMIRVGEELVVTSPEPALSIDRQEEVYYEEDYEADIQYVYNDDWYTTDTQILQQPSAGHRKVAALKSYHNKKETETEILKEEVTVAAVPKIIEKGTKIPPTYIKPISGGRLSSQFGRRKAPTKGASTYHKGVDWATPVGTKVVASSAGTVARAGWGSGYGYVVYINHADGRQTRYGHLSKVLVRVGDQVSQGQKIALSGNTGRSTGAHLHFEILIGGAQVNPLQYLN